MRKKPAVKYSRQTIALAEEIVSKCTECKRCMPDCVFLQTYCQTPKELFIRVLKNDVDSIVPYSCMLCGHCTLVCPYHLPLDKAFLSMRQDLMKQSPHLPLKQLRGVVLHQFFSTSQFFTAVNPGGKTK